MGLFYVTLNISNLNRYISYTYLSTNIKSQIVEVVTMMTICTEEDLMLLRKEFNETVKILRDEINELKMQLGVSTASCPKDKQKRTTSTRSFGSVVALEEYVDKVILSAKIPNLDKAELEIFKNRKTTYYIRDMIDKCATAEDREYLLSAPVRRKLKRVDTWVKDPRFTEIVYYCLPKYRDGYLTERYKNIDKLHSCQSRARIAGQNYRASLAVEAAKAEIVGKCNEEEFSKRLERAIKHFKSTPQYEKNYHSLVSIIRKVLKQFTPEEIQECYDAFYLKNRYNAKRELDAIRYVPEYAFRYIEAFEKIVYLEN